MKKIIWILTLILPLCAGAPNIDSKLIPLVRIETRINAYIDNYLKLQKRIESLLFAIKMVESNGNYFSIEVCFRLEPSELVIISFCKGITT